MEWTEKFDLLDEEQQEHLAQVVEGLLAGEMPRKHTLYPIKLSYSVEYIREIVKLFSPTKKWTCADLENEAIFPPDLKLRMQLLDYKIYIMRPTFNHQRFLTRVSARLSIFAQTHDLGEVCVAPVGVHISEGNCLEPDIVLVLKKDLSKATDKGVFVPPALVIEVISRANYKKLPEAKKQKYADFGVEEYWEVYPAKKKISVEILEKAA